VSEGKIMHRLGRWTVAGVASLAAVAAARADVVVVTPFVTVRVARPARPLPAAPVAPSVEAPGLPPAPGEPPPVPIPAVPVPAVEVPAVAARAPTLAEFAAAFKPAPGTYKVVVQHPCTGCPVEVCFTLPPGCPRKVRVHKRMLDFDYGRHDVRIRFLADGGVRVRG
jgi:hypothetical protein